MQLIFRGTFLNVWVDSQTIRQPTITNQVLYLPDWNTMQTSQLLRKFDWFSQFSMHPSQMLHVRKWEHIPSFAPKITQFCGPKKNGPDYPLNKKSPQNCKMSDVWRLWELSNLAPQKNKTSHGMVFARSQIHILRGPGPPTTANLDTPGISASPVPGWVVGGWVRQPGLWHSQLNGKS